MRFPTFWTRVYNASKTVVARGWSEHSLEEATRNAQERLERILAALKSSGHFGLDLDRYAYVADDVICEEVIDRVLDDDGQEIAVVSRNAYGSLILNTAKMMFVDIDFDVPSRGGCLFGCFVKQKPQVDPQEKTLASVRLWQAEHPETTLRVYRTARGIRLMVVSRLFDSVDEQVVEMLQQLGSDSLYVQLCRSQNCFRARLTPKPWRVGLKNPPAMFPFGSAEDQSQFDDWQSRYLAQAKKYKVCTLIETLGDSAVHPGHALPIEMHDRLCCNERDLPLA